MLRTTLSDSQRAELPSLRRADVPAVARDRLGMVLLPAGGWPPPTIAGHLGRHPHTVRAALKGYPDRGAQAFDPAAPGPDPGHARRTKATGRLTELLGQDRTWAARPLAASLGPDIGVGHRPTRRHLALLRAGHRRTAQTVGHQQDPKTAGRAGGVLANLKQKWRPAG